VATRLERLRAARLYLVCDDQPTEFLRAALRGGVEMVELRLKESPDATILEAAARFAPICAENDALFILNDRPDLVPDAGADGVHVGQDDVSVGEARTDIGPERILGLSTHSSEQVDDARNAGPDYISVGPVHQTPTKPGRPAVGLELVRYATLHAPMPFFAIGGISADNLEHVLGAGARRVAVVRALTEAEDPERAARGMRAALDRGAVL
jgi:thiamine-phosphate pyrophosphorylase